MGSIENSEGLFITQPKYLKGMTQLAKAKKKTNKFQKISFTAKKVLHVFIKSLISIVAYSFHAWFMLALIVIKCFIANSVIFLSGNSLNVTVVCKTSLSSKSTSLYRFKPEVSAFLIFLPVGPHVLSTTGPWNRWKGGAPDPLFLYVFKEKLK